MQHFITPPSHNRGRARWSEYPDPPDNPCPPPPAIAGDMPLPATPASESLWFAPGAADLTKLPERSEWFEDVWYGLTSGVWPRGTRKKQRTGGDPAFIDHALKLHRQQEEILSEIRQDGFVWLGGDDDDGHYVPAFTEVGRRSAVAGAHVIRRVVAQTERKPMSGNTKGAVVKELRKEAAMLADYVVLNRRVRGVIRVDNDMTFRSWVDVYSWLVYLLDEGEIPCLPHLAVAKRSADGWIRKPHFLILLPVGDEVRGDKRCRGGARGLMRAVENGWIRALQGDPGGAYNSRKIKSPTCPRMLVGIFNQSRFLTLGEMAETLDCSRLDDRRAAAEDSGLEVKASNNVFTETKTIAWPMVARMCDLNDPRYPKWVANREMFHEGLFGMLIGQALARHSGDKPAKAIEKIVRHVCRRVARDWDPKCVSRPPDRGVMGLPADMPLDGEDGKWHKSGQWSSAQRLAKTLEAMADEIALIESAGSIAREVDLVATRKWCKATIYKRFGDAVLLHVFRSTPVAGKKDTTHPASTAVESANASSDPCCNGEVGKSQIASSFIKPKQQFDPCRPTDHTDLAAQNIGPIETLSILIRVENINDHQSKPSETEKAEVGSSQVDAEGLRSNLPCRSTSRRYTNPPAISRDRPANAGRRIYRTFTGDRSKAVGTILGESQIDPERRRLAALFSGWNDEALERARCCDEETDLTFVRQAGVSRAVCPLCSVSDGFGQGSATSLSVNSRDREINVCRVFGDTHGSGDEKCNQQ